MKTIRFIVPILSALLLCSAIAQQPAQRKPPVGVPTDAQYFNGKWYRVYLERVPWDRAKEKCASLGGQLAVAPDEQTWAFIKGLLQTITWMGGTDEKTEGVWQWVDGTSFTFNAFTPGQPDNTGGNENYLSATAKGWNDVPKHGKFGDYHVSAFLCEWKDRR